ncbi:hypothetical protein KIPB_001253 [Kipferlia bialata]|uniref:Uncharacterized protein n=1 Tax=Kipferlia bialata TaxID=797122 RepID=A0A9K3CQ11_9EUKA|nr:hypothetical protein KIPB_001253 [Kipferlia bialata]|eukprot:g1253.t1
MQLLTALVAICLFAACAASLVPTSFTIDDYDPKPGYSGVIYPHWYNGSTELPDYMADTALVMSKTSNIADAETCSYITSSSRWQCGYWDEWESIPSQTFYAWCNGVSIGSDNVLFSTGRAIKDNSSIAPTNIVRGVSTPIVLTLLDANMVAFIDNTPDAIEMTATMTAVYEANPSSETLDCTFNSSDSTWPCGSFTLPANFDSARDSVSVNVYKGVVGETKSQFGVFSMTVSGSVPAGPLDTNCSISAQATAKVCI